MKDRKAPSGYIERLWSQGKLKKLTIGDILLLAESEGYTFRRDSIWRALSQSKFVAKPKRIENVMTYSQKYPPDQDSTIDVEESYVLVFKKLKLHEDIKRVSSKLFLDSHYDQAVFVAFREVNILVKKKSKQHKDGKSLMTLAFSRNQPILKVNNLATDSEKDEQEGFMHIFAGAMQGVRNPRGHSDEIDENPWDAIELLCLASLLVKKLERSKLSNTIKPKNKILTK